MSCKIDLHRSRTFLIGKIENNQPVPFRFVHYELGHLGPNSSCPSNISSIQPSRAVIRNRPFREEMPMCSNALTNSFSSTGTHEQNGGLCRFLVIAFTWAWRNDRYLQLRLPRDLSRDRALMIFYTEIIMLRAEAPNAPNLGIAS